MENFLSKIFTSKNKRRVYNVDKSKKQNLKKVNKNVNQLSSAYVTNKLRKEFGIYKPKSEFSSTNYNIPCSAQTREHSLESLDILPQNFKEEQNIDLVKCTEEQRMKNRGLLFVNDGHSDMEPESINKEFEIDENEGGEHRMSVEHIEIHTVQILQKLDRPRFAEAKDQEETSNNSSLTTMDLRKDSLYGRYEDACVKLNSYKCNKEFIFESKRILEVQLNNGNQTCVRKHDNQQERQVSAFNETPSCSSFSGANNSAAKKGNTNDIGTSEGLHNSNKFIMTKKGRVKCKSPDKEKTKKRKGKDDDGLSRHRNYHSMIIMGGKRKSKSSLSKNIKITNTQILEMTQKKFGSDISDQKNTMSIQFLPSDKKRLNLMQKPGSTVRTMCYRNANNQICSVNIPPSEHTLKWLDENFGPGSAIINNSEETDFSDPLEDLSLKMDPVSVPPCSKIEPQSEQLEVEPPQNNTQEEAIQEAANHSTAEENNHERPIDIAFPLENTTETDDKIDTDQNNETDYNSLKNQMDSNTESQRKTVKVMSFKKSRISKNNSNSYENNVDNINSKSHINIKDITETNVNIHNPNDSKNASNNATSEAFENTLDDINEKHETIFMNTDDCTTTTVDEPIEKIAQEFKTTEENSTNTSEPDHSCAEKALSLENISTVNEKHNEHVTETEIMKIKEINQIDATENLPVTINGPSEKDYTTNLKLQNENIFSILRDQEKKSLLQKNGETRTIQENVLDHKVPELKVDDTEKIRDDGIVLKLNDKIIHITDPIKSELIKRQESIGPKKKCSEEESKRRHEELEKDYIMTRLELALNTEVIENPEMAKYILEKSQEVMKDVVDKTNETLTRKLLAKNSVTTTEGNTANQPEESSIKIDENLLTEKENVTNEIQEPVPEIKENAKPPKETETTFTSYINTKEEVPKSTGKDLNNISKIENVKIYRKENKKADGKKPVLIRINSIDNIMKNKSLLLEEIKSFKKKK